MMSVTKRGPYQRWSKHDEQTLAKLAHRQPPHIIAKKMGRSTNSVIVRMKQRRISRRNRDGWYTASDAAQILGCDNKWIVRRINDGSLKARRHHLGAPPANGAGQNPWHIREKDLRNFIRQFPQDLQGRNVDVTAIVDILAGLA